MSSTPIFAALIAIRFDSAERVAGWGIVGIVTGMVGVALIVGVDVSGADYLIGVTFSDP